MRRFDITKTNIAVERLIETTNDPRHLYMLHAYNRHRYLEMAGRYEEIFAPDMTVEKPVYHFNMLGKTLTVEGAEAVKPQVGAGKVELEQSAARLEQVQSELLAMVVAGADLTGGGAHATVSNFGLSRAL